MKIILLKDVPSVGHKNEVVEIADGYARNYIIPKKLGILATSGAIEKLKKQKENQKEKLKDEIREMISLQELINESEISIEAKPDLKGNIIGSISTKQIADAISSQLNIKINKNKIKKKIISSFGITKIKINLIKGVEANLKVNVGRK